MRKPHLLDAKDLLRISKAIEWPLDTLENQVRYIQAVNNLQKAMWGNLQPFELWNRLPAWMRNSFLIGVGQFLDLTKFACEMWTQAAYQIEQFMGNTGSGGAH